MMHIWKRALLVGATGLGLASCQETRGGFGLAGRGSPAGVPIAFESIEGPPATVQTALAGELASAASSRQVELVGTGVDARYRVRGYLTTEHTADGGAALAFVWDVFDAEKRRARRFTGTSPIRTAAGDPWSGLDKEALRRLAAESMDEIATFLSASAAGAAEQAPSGEPTDG
jgi:hypothetical protein